MGCIFLPRPPQNSGTTGRIYKIQMVLDRSGEFVEVNLILLTSVTDDVTGQVKVKKFDDLESLALSRTRAVWNGNKSI